jgi:hypothetical protein
VLYLVVDNKDFGYLEVAGVHVVNVVNVHSVAKQGGKDAHPSHNPGHMPD